MININNISKSYEKGKIKALDHINLSIHSGELFGLIGPDGAGKTSLIRIVASLILPDTGNAYLFDLDCIKDYTTIRKIIGYMPGKFSLYQDLTVEENLNFFANVFKSDIHQNYHLIKDLYDQLAPYKNRRAGKLSGGMKQKLALCCAMIHEPRVLLLDEPTTGVDPVSRNEFWQMLLNLKKRGITILVSTPYMDEASLCDRIALIQSGKILDTGTPEEICIKSGLKMYSLHTTDVFYVMKALKTYKGITSCFAFGSSIHITLKPDDTDALKAYLSSIGYVDIDIRPIAPGIEDVFMDKLNQGV